MSDYNLSFYNKMMARSELSASKVLPVLFSLVKPESMLDFGCGVGCWLSVAKKLGVVKVHGFDGAYVDKKQLRISENDFYAINLAEQLPERINVDVAISLEVAEHLTDLRADLIVEYLTSCSDVVYFGAAIPQQGGTHHVNEQWQSYWAKKFDGHGYLVSTILRDRLWSDPDVEVWYKQNALLFVKPGKHPALDVTLKKFDEALLDIVHPDLYMLKMSRYRYFESAVMVLQKYLNYVRSAAILGRK